MKLIVKLIEILIVQIILFIIPVMYLNEFIQGACFMANLLLTWAFLKALEKTYYPKFNKGMSMLYMSCPLIGIGILMYVFYLITKELFLINYYVPLFIGILLFNLIYIIGYKIRNKQAN